MSSYPKDIESIIFDYCIGSSKYWKSRLTFALNCKNKLWWKAFDHYIRYHRGTNYGLSLRDCQELALKTKYFHF